MLRHKTFQNKIAVSRFSLPVTATLIAMIWVAVGLVQSDIWTELAFALASTLLMVELNNRNALMGKIKKPPMRIAPGAFSVFYVSL